MSKSYDKFVILFSDFTGYVRQHIKCILSFVLNVFILCVVICYSLYVYCNNLPLVANTRSSIFTGTGRTKRSGWHIGLYTWILWMMRLSHSHRKLVFIEVPWSPSLPKFKSTWGLNKMLIPVDGYQSKLNCLLC